jgi:predicted regulator of Ras-like GTPase activity (Roadblock/LC7/MglB family)
MKQRVKGRVENLTLASFLQLLEMERKTCSLAVSSLGHHGLLYLRDGHLVGAEMAGLKGQPAALEIVTWENADIEISDHVPPFEPEIEATLRFLLMEGMRLKDERQEAGAPVAPPPPPPPVVAPRRSALDLGIAFGEIMKRGQDIKGSQGLLLVDTDGGEVLGAAGASEGVDLGTTMALPAAQFLRQERRVAERLGLGDPLQDVVVTTSERYYLIRVVGPGEHFLLLVLDRHKANLAQAQLDLVALERSLAG